MRWSEDWQRNANSSGLEIGCDANAHHNNDRGESLFDFILNLNLFLCNRGNVPAFITKT